MRKVSTLLLIWVLGVTQACAQISPQEPPIGKRDLQRLSPAARLAIQQFPVSRYRGIRRVFRLNNGRQLIETVSKDGVQLRIDRDASGETILVNAQGARRLNRKKNEVYEMPRPFGKIRNEIMMGQVARNGFSMIESEGHSVAGFPTTLVTIRDAKGEIARELYIEPNSGAILKMDAYSQGALQGGFEFTTIDFRPSFANDAFELNATGAKVVSLLDQNKAKIAASGFKLVDLKDPRYRLINVMFNTTGGQPSMQAVYAGPGGQLSLFQVRGTFDASKFSRISNGKVNAHSWKRGDITFILVSRRSKAELETLSAQVSQSQ